MGLLKKTPEQQAESDEKRFERSTAGLARAAFERGDHVFQHTSQVMSQQSIIALSAVSTPKLTNDPSSELNSICREGWELVNGSFVFVEQGSQERGGKSATKGQTVGYYLFRRSEALRQPE